MLVELGWGTLEDWYRNTLLYQHLGTEGIHQVVSQPVAQCIHTDTFATFSDAVATFLAHPVSIPHACLTFQEWIQGPTETVSELITALHELATDCRFTDPGSQEMLVHQMLAGCQSKEVKWWMLLCNLNADDYLHILETEEHIMEDIAVLEAVQNQQHQFQHQQHQAGGKVGKGIGSLPTNSELICFSCGHKGHKWRLHSAIWRLHCCSKDSATEATSHGSFWPPWNGPDEAPSPWNSLMARPSHTGQATGALLWTMPVEQQRSATWSNPNAIDSKTICTLEMPGHWFGWSLYMPLLLCASNSLSWWSTTIPATLKSYWPLTPRHSSALICWLQSLFACYSCPDELVMDNGPQFWSHEFQVFLEETAVKGLPVANYNPWENGLVECWNKTLREGIQAFCLASVPWKEGMTALLTQHRAMMSITNGPSPTELFLNCRICMAYEVRLPIAESLCLNSNVSAMPAIHMVNLAKVWPLFCQGEKVIVCARQVPKGASPYRVESVHTSAHSGMIHIIALWWPELQCLPPELILGTFHGPYNVDPIPIPQPEQGQGWAENQEGSEQGQLPVQEVQGHSAQGAEPRKVLRWTVRKNAGIPPKHSKPVKKWAVSSFHSGQVFRPSWEGGCHVHCP